MNMTAPVNPASMSRDATLVIVPRERFSRAVDSLNNILELTPPGFDLVYLADGGPAATLERLRSTCEQRGFRFTHVRERATSNQLRNLGLRQVKTPYVVFMDNDVFVSRGWLDSLVNCARETGAWIAGPLYLFGELGDNAIHMAGGEAHFSTDNGVRRYRQSLRHIGRYTHEVELRREPTEHVEFHCMLADTAQLRALGAFDEGLLNSRDHDDICMRAREAGGSVYFEPSARVAYNPQVPLAPGDRWYYWIRWSELWNMRSLLHFSRKWDLDWRRNPQEQHHFDWCREYRQRMFHPYVARTRRLLVERWARRIWRRLLRLEVLLNRMLASPPAFRSASRPD